uniref:Uncharacterized protein n=1 Tax=Mesocestoides corti TaxID=53468 RepID=A0A5K3FRX2_MESCO
MLDNLHNMYNLLTARLHATSDAEDADAIRAAFPACEDADNVLRSAGIKLAAAKTIQRIIIRVTLDTSIVWTLIRSSQDSFVL